MFKNKTVFVLGAGASREVNLPDGVQLMADILTALRPGSNGMGLGDPRIAQTVIEMGERRGVSHQVAFANYAESAAKIRNALPYARSIDTYLDSQAGDLWTTELGKIAIARCLLQSEGTSWLARHSGFATQATAAENLAKSWFVALSRILTAGHRAETVEAIFDQVAFVVFNYDRCLEVFLRRMLCEYFAIEADRAIEIVSAAKILHVYGQVGRLGSPHQGAEFVPFGGHITTLASVSDQLQTYTEALDEQRTAEIRKLVQEAESLVFLGFGFLPSNLDVLTPSGDNAIQRIFGSVYGVSLQNQKSIHGDLVARFGARRGFDAQNAPPRYQQFSLELANATCRALLDNNLFELSAP